MKELAQKDVKYYQKNINDHEAVIDATPVGGSTTLIYRGPIPGAQAIMEALENASYTHELVVTMLMLVAVPLSAGDVKVARQALFTLSKLMEIYTMNFYPLRIGVPMVETNLNRMRDVLAIINEIRKRQSENEEPPDWGPLG
jgi:hypothetical protein